MSLIVGQYYRGNPKQKPKQWGAASVVSSVIADRLGDWYGIQWSFVDLAFFFWGPKNQINYANSQICQLYGPIFEKNKLYFDGVNDYILLPKLSSNLNFTIFGASEFNTIFSTFIDIAAVSTLTTVNWSIQSNSSNKLSIYTRGHTGNPAIVYNETSLAGTGIRKFFCEHESGVSCKLFLDNISKKVETATTTTAFHVSANVSGIGALVDSTKSSFLKGHADYVLKIDTILSDNIKSEINDNIYSLFQPPTFRTYFDLAESGTTLSFTAINSNSDLNNNFLSAIRLLNPTNISCFTEISDSIISGLVNIINGNDLLADSQITQASVQAIRKLLGQEISSVSQITDIVISTAKQFNLTDLNSLTEVTNVVFSVIHQINNNDLLSNSQVINLAINVIRQININSIESISDITEVVLSITGGIIGIDVEAQTEITSLALSILRVLKENNVESNSSVNEATLNVIHKLDFNNISSLSEITDIVTVAGSNIGIKDNNSLTQITQVILDIIKAVSPININIQSEIDNPVINVLRTLFSNTVNVISNVTSVGVTNISTIATGKVTITFSMAVPSISWSLE